MVDFATVFAQATIASRLYRFQLRLAIEPRLSRLLDVLTGLGKTAAGHANIALGVLDCWLPHRIEVKCLAYLTLRMNCTHSGNRSLKSAGNE